MMRGRMLSRFFSTLSASSSPARSLLSSPIAAKAWRRRVTMVAGSTSPVLTIGACKGARLTIKATNPFLLEVARLAGWQMAVQTSSAD